MRTACILIVFAFAASGQETGATKTGADAVNADAGRAQKPPEKGHIVGKITNEVTGEPLKKVMVQAFPSDSQKQDSVTTTTDESGKFAMDDVEPGKYTLHASRNGFVRRSYGSSGREDGTMLSVGPGGTVEANFKLTPQSVVTGRIVDEDGEAVANVHVNLLRYSWQNGKRTLSAGGSGSTNDLGEYRIFGVSPAKYFLSAIYNPNQFSMGRATSAMADADYPTVYYPGTTDPQGATKLEVTKSGQLTGIDMKLMKARSYRIRGKVMGNLPGMAKPGRMMVTLTPKSQDQSGGVWETNRITQTDEDGTFEIRGVMPGTYMLMGNTFGGDGTARGRQEVSVEKENVSGVVLTLSPGWDMKGTVRVEGDAAIRLSQISLMLVAEDSSAMMMGGQSVATLKDDGSFVFKDVGPERYQLKEWGLPDGYYVKSAHAGSASLIDGAVDMSTVQGAAIAVVLSPKGAVAEGTVKNEKDEPVTTGTVVLVPEIGKRSNHDLFKQTSLDQYGHYKMTGIRPGSYSLYAFQGVEQGIWEDPDYLRTIEKEAVAVKLEESGDETNDLKVIVGAEN